MDNYNYPMGADTPLAPWNQEEPKEEEIEVTVSITMSKTIKIKVSDYETLNEGMDEDGEYAKELDFSNCDLYEAVEDQVILPFNAAKYTNKVKAKEDLSNWNVDDFIVEKE